jgi:hypothetical protein
MEQQAPLPPVTAEPRSVRTEFYFDEPLRLGIKELAARFGVSSNEVVLRCLEYALSNPKILAVLEDTAATFRSMGPIPHSDYSRRGRSEHNLTASSKQRLRETAARLQTGEQRLACLCVQHTLLDPRLHQLIQAGLAARNGKKLGRTVRPKEENHSRAA